MVRVLGGMRPFEEFARTRVIGPGGCMIVSPESLGFGSLMELSISMKGRVLRTDGRVVGFLLGWVGESEFGIAQRTGWVDLIGVDPPYRGHGVAQTLLRRFVYSCRELRAIEKVATLIDLGQADVREFFTRVGFHHGPMIQMERSIGP